MASRMLTMSKHQMTRGSRRHPMESLTFFPRLCHECGMDCCKCSMMDPAPQANNGSHQRLASMIHPCPPVPHPTPHPRKQKRQASKTNTHSFISLPLSLLPARRFQSGHDQRLLRRSHMPVIRSIPENKRRVRTGCLSCRKRRRKCSYDPIPLISPCASGYFGWYPA